MRTPVSQLSPFARAGLLVALCSSGFAAQSQAGDGRAAESATGPSKRVPQLEEVRIIGRRDTRFEPVENLFSARVDADSQLSLNRTVGDWIDALPGVSLNGQGGLLQSYSVRGFSRWRVRTEIDGVPIITDRRAGNSASFVAPELLGSVRVDKSASSVLYGSGAMGGVVSLATARPDDTALLAEARSNDRFTALTALSGDGERRFTGLSLRSADRAEAADGSELDSAYEQVSAVLAGTSTVRDLEIAYRWLPSIGRDIGKSSSLYPDRRISSYPDERHSLASVELRAADWLLRAYHHYQDWDADVERIGRRRNLTSYQSSTIGGLAQRAADLGPLRGVAGLEWIGRRGVSIIDREFDSAGELLTQQQLVDGDEDTLGAFLNQGWSGGPFGITAGLRLDQMWQSNAGRRDSDLQGSASLAADVVLAPGWQARAELASGYRFPGLSERYFNGVTPRGEVRGNPALEPETRRSVELGLEYAPLERRLSLRTVAYYSRLSDYIERVALSERLVTYRNVDDASLYGAELDLLFSAGSFEHHLGYQWQRGEDDAGNVLADLNPPGWRYRLRWVGDPWQVNSDLSYRPQRSDFGVEEQALDAAWVWNLSLARPLGAGWAGELYLSNALDEEFRATADEQAPLQPGRALGIRIRWQPG